MTPNEVPFLKIGNSQISLLRRGRIVSESSSVRGLTRLLRHCRGPLYFVSVVPRLSRHLKKVYGGAREVRLEDISLMLPYKNGIGIDRVLNIVGAKKILKQAFVVVDFGTATTVEFFDRRYRGGWILPGVGLMFDSLARRTAQLPLGQLGKQSSLRPGRSSRQSIEAGILAAQVGVLRLALIEAKQQMPRQRVRLIVTGGFAESLRQKIRPMPRVCSDLLFRGLQEVVKGFLVG